MNAATIVRYRSAHRIKPVAAIRSFGPVTACETCGIRIHPNHGKGAIYRHDPGEVKEAAGFAEYVRRHDDS